jgi:DNA-binding transcriptional ArsR family regulator
VIELLRKKPLRASELADAFAVTRPAMSRHLKILRRAGLVAESELEDDARVRLYRLEREPFVELRSWVAEVEDYWSHQLASFKAHAERKQRGTK